MSEPDIDLEDRNPLGGIDLLATGVGFAVIAVFPTLLATLFTPWKLAPLLEKDEPTGRQGVLLAPGAYMVLSLGVVLFMVGSLVSPEYAQYDGGLIGPRLASEVSSAAREGNVWLTLSRIAPVFIIAVSFGAIGQCLRPLAGDWWDLRTSLRAAFYALSTAVCCIVLSSLAIDIIRRMSGETVQSMSPPVFLPFLVIGSIYWIYFWCFRSGGGLSLVRSAVLTAGMFFLTLLFFSAAGMLLFSEGVIGNN